MYDTPGGPTGHDADAVRALRVLQQRPGASRRPVALVGPREASDRQLRCAHRVGRVLGAASVPVLCGGKGGVMAAAARGVHEEGGVVIGLLPEDDEREANPWLSVALPTGLGITRNALIARAARLVIAVGGGLGTTSEMALALQWGTPVLSIHEAPPVPGALVMDGEDRLLAALVSALQAQAAGHDAPRR